MPKVSVKDLTTAFRYINYLTTSPHIQPYVFLQCQKDEIVLKATNLDIFLQINIPATSTTQFQTTVPVEPILKLLLSEPKDAFVELNLKKKLFLQVNNTKTTLSVQDPNEFPEFPPFPEPKYPLNSDTLLNLYNKVAFAPEKNTEKIISGVLLSLQSNLIRLVGTDGYRLALSETTIANAITQDIVVFPLVFKLCLPNVPVDLAFDDRRFGLYFSSDSINFKIVSNIMDGKFPDYQKVITDKPHYFVADTQKFKEYLRRLKIFSNAVYWNIQSDKIILSSSNAELGSIVQEVEIDVHGSPMKILLNVDYLNDVLKVIETPQFLFKYNDQSSAIQITPIQSNSSLYLIMPIQYTEDESDQS